MERGRSHQLETTGQEQLPFVSVFLVLLCMLGALNSFSGPSSSQFEDVRVSVRKTFVGTDVASVLVKQEHSAQTKQALRDLCNDYSGQCTQVETSFAIGTLAEFDTLAFEASAEGLSPQGDGLLRKAAQIAKVSQSNIVVALPLDADLGQVRLLILADLLERYSGMPVSLAKMPGLVSAPLGFAFMPKATS